MDKPIQELRYKKNFVHDSKLPHIRWNLESSKEDKEFDDSMADYFFFINYRNPEKILKDIEKQFRDFSFGFSFNKVNELDGRVAGTVNNYIFANYQASQGPVKFSFGWTNLPVIRDEKLSNYYQKKWDIKKYVLSLVK